jgi:hypothetical protein
MNNKKIDKIVDLSIASVFFCGAFFFFIMAMSGLIYLVGQLV